MSKLQAGVRGDCTDDVTPANAIRQTWLPGCGEGNKTNSEIDTCGGSCFNSSLIIQVEDFYVQRGFKMVSFKSRAGHGHHVDLKAWWIPGANKTSPRVVVQHGTNQNQNKFEALMAGFVLASAGFGVLMPSLRDHGFSGDSSHKRFSWGWDYPYDTLGAWDYAKNDPDNVLGSALSADQVGVMGFSMGGFVAVTAFGMEGGIPGVWADAPVYSVKKILLNELHSALPVKLVGDMAIDLAWAKANEKVELHYNWPEKTLPTGPDTKRKVFLVTNTEDTKVPDEHAELFKSLFSAHGTKYAPVQQWKESQTCNGDTHRIFHLKDPSTYRERLCSFWTDVFGPSQGVCTDMTPIN